MFTPSYLPRFRVAAAIVVAAGGATLLGAANSRNPLMAAEFSWVSVGDAGNFSGPDSFGRSLGAVDYDNRIGKSEVTDGQYTEFLNAKDPGGTNSLGLYNSKMTTDGNGGINFDAIAASGSKYSVKPGDTKHLAVAAPRPGALTIALSALLTAVVCRHCPRRRAKS